MQTEYVFVIYYVLPNFKGQTDLISGKNNKGQIRNKTGQNLKKYKTSPKVTMSLIKMYSSTQHSP